MTLLFLKNKTKQIQNCLLNNWTEFMCMWVNNLCFLDSRNIQPINRKNVFICCASHCAPQAAVHVWGHANQYERLCMCVCVNNQFVWPSVIVACNGYMHDCMFTSSFFSLCRGYCATRVGFELHKSKSKVHTSPNFLASVTELSTSLSNYRSTNVIITRAAFCLLPVGPRVRTR